jgi:putative phosphoribosyl transferase
MVARFRDRVAAGEELASRIQESRGLVDPIIIALPRGGVPVAQEVAQRLGAPLDVLVVRKIGAPEQPELACGAATSDGSIVWNESILFSLGVTQHELRREREKALREVGHLEEALRSPQAPALSVFAKTAVVVDDGLATGATMKAAVKALLRQKPHKIVVAVPVAPDDTCREIEDMGYEVICPRRVPKGELSSVGEWYEDFSQVESSTCRLILASNRSVAHHPSGGEQHVH